MLLCTVRDCHLPLARAVEEGGRRLVCPRGHSFDVARSGYINLLQPQDRRSKQPGDTPEAVAARRRLHDLGVTGPLLEGIAEMVQASPEDIVLDAGCGDGFYLGSLTRQSGCAGHGVDISIPAVEAAARRYPPSGVVGGANYDPAVAGYHPGDASYEWIVANADRFVPYADRSFSLVLTITGRMNAAEFRRVLRDDGRLLVAISAPNDLIELRSRAGKPGRDRVPQALETFAPGFKLVGRSQVTTAADLDAAAAQDVLLSIYRPLRSHPVEATRVTFSLDLLLFQPA
jgi:23S rRNA (guanine745-N1)-methyltransferase